MVQLRAVGPEVFRWLAQLLQLATVVPAISCFKEWLDHRAFPDEGLPADAIRALTEQAFGSLKGKKIMALFGILNVLHILYSHLV